MGSDPNEGKGRKKKAQAEKGAQPDFWSWHPTEAQKRQFEEWIGDGQDLAAHLDEITRIGIVLTITRTKTNDGACVVARNRFDNYGEGQALSTFNACPLRALYGMVFVLSVLYPQWPSQAVSTLQRALDW